MLSLMARSVFSVYGLMLCVGDDLTKFMFRRRSFYSRVCLFLSLKSDVGHGGVGSRFEINDNLFDTHVAFGSLVWLHLII
jgi:hypothetical protein